MPYYCLFHAALVFFKERRAKETKTARPKIIIRGTINFAPPVSCIIYRLNKPCKVTAIKSPVKNRRCRFAFLKNAREIKYPKAPDTKACKNIAPTNLKDVRIITLEVGANVPNLNSANIFSSAANPNADTIMYIGRSIGSSSSLLLKTQNQTTPNFNNSSTNAIPKNRYVRDSGVTIKVFGDPNRKKIILSKNAAGIVIKAPHKNTNIIILFGSG